MKRDLHLYSVYGVAIRSEWPLEFPRPVDCGSGVAKVDFVEGTEEDFSDADEFRDADGPWFRSHVFPNRSRYVRWSGLYEFCIDAAGTRVACRPLDGCDRGVLQNFLFGQALSFALVLQGLEPLHAAVVRVEDSALGFLGDSTFGKSTLLAAFLQDGHRLVTDDLLMPVARDGDIIALPGTGRIKLHPDSARMFLGGMGPGEPLNPQTPKRSFPLDVARVQRTGSPLRQLFVLPTPEERRRMTSIEIRPLARAELFHALLKNAFNTEILTRERIERQFESAAQLAVRIDGFRLQYPEGLQHIPLVRQCIVDHICRTPSADRRSFQ